MDLQTLQQECLACQRCGLCQTRTNVVFGQGVPSNLTNAQAMAVFSLAIQLQLVAMRLYWAEFSDAEMAHQNIMVGPITQGDAKAVLDKLSAVGAKGTAQAA